jgi:hypothetical protein
MAIPPLKLRVVPKLGVALKDRKSEFQATGRDIIAEQ